MNTTTLLIIVVCLALVFLAGVGGAVFFFLRQGDAEEEAPKKKGRSSKKRRKAARSQKEEAAEEKEPLAEADEFEEEPQQVPAAATPPPPVGGDAAAATDEKIRLLIVDDNTDTRENVKRLLYFENDIDVIGQAVNGREGIDQSIELRPHIVLMDINMPDVDGITATGEMTQRAPYSQVIIMSVQTEHHYMRQAMAAGARDFQPKPFTAEELITCIRRVYQIGLPTFRQIEAAEKREALEKKKVAKENRATIAVTDRSPMVAIYSPKGGVGTSTLAINLAVALQQEQSKVVLMDGDFQFGDISVHLNTQPRRTINDVIQDNMYELELLPDIVVAHNSGLKLLLAPSQPEYADVILPDLVEQTIGALRNHFKAIVVDTPTQLTDRNLAILEEADLLLVLTMPELPAVKNVKAFMELLQKLEFDMNRVTVVINRDKLPGGVNSDQIEAALELDFTYRVPYDPKMISATRLGVSLVQDDANAPATRAIQDMAYDIWERLMEK